MTKRNNSLSNQLSLKKVLPKEERKEKIGLILIIPGDIQVYKVLRERNVTQDYNKIQQPSLTTVRDFLG